jgi:hypothetical protein
MQTSQRVFETDSIDLASFLGAAGYTPTVERNDGGNRALFTFIECPELLTAIISYERGAALPAKRLLNARSWLYNSNTALPFQAGLFSHYDPCQKHFTPVTYSFCPKYLCKISN